MECRDESYMYSEHYVVTLKLKEVVTMMVKVKTTMEIMTEDYGGWNDGDG